MIIICMVVLSLFVGIYIVHQLDLLAPTEFCSNCGSKGKATYRDCSPCGPNPLKIHCRAQTLHCKECGTIKTTITD